MGGERRPVSVVPAERTKLPRGDSVRQIELKLETGPSDHPLLPGIAQVVA